MSEIKIGYSSGWTRELEMTPVQMITPLQPCKRVWARRTKLHLDSSPTENVFFKPLSFDAVDWKALDN